METPWYYEVPAWVNAGLLLGILLLAVEAGFRVGLKHFRSSTDERLKARGDVTLTAMLALLGLVLAFTYAFSLSRADLRKQAIVEEANAIGTAFLRADLAAEPGRTELRRLLLDYAQTRILGPEMRGTHEQTVAVIARSEAALAALWPATKRVVLIGNPDPFKASIFQAINETIDAHTRRISVVFDRLPVVVFALMVLIAAAALAVAAHNAGLNGTMSRWRMTIFAVVLAALMLVILDFEQGRRGFIQMSDAPLQAVVREMDSALARGP